MKIKKKQIIGIGMLVIILMLIIMLNLLNFNFEKYSYFFFIIILLISIIVINKVDEPMFLYSVYTLTIPIELLYSKYFNKLSNWRYSKVYEVDLFEEIIIYILVSIIMLSIGYNLLPINYKIRKIKFRKKYLSYISNIYIFIGIINFIYIFIFYSNGLEIFYKFNYFMRKIGEEGGSTLGYTFFFPVGVYLKSYIKARENKSNTFYIILGIIFSITTGRITRTLIFIISNIFIYNIYNKKLTKKIFFKKILILIVVGAIFYYVRILTSYIHYGKSAPIYEELILLGKRIIENGNFPNLPILPEIFKYFDKNEFLNGRTILAIFSPKESAAFFIRDNIYKLSSTEGSLPPTIYGEFYMNFGYIKSIILFFLLGILYRSLYLIYIKTNNIFIKLIYIDILTSYIMLSSKGTFSNISFLRIGLLIFTLMIVKVMTLMELKK